MRRAPSDRAVYPAAGTGGGGGARAGESIWLRELGWNGEFRKDYKEKHPNVKQVSVIGKAGGDMWKSLSDAEKAPYVSKAEKLKVEYTKKMDAYNNKQSGGGPTLSGDSDKSKSEVNDGDEEGDE